MKQMTAFPNGPAPERAARLVRRSGRHCAPVRMQPWLRAFCQRAVWTRALAVGLPIGCLQAVINQGDLWWQQRADGVVLVKTLLSPFITFSVAWLSAAATWIEQHQNRERL